MRFALLGDAADGADLAWVLAARGHSFLAYAGSPAGHAQLARRGLTPPRLLDLEEILADPALDAVVVAATPSQRAVTLRRALQSGHHVLCVHPADAKPDVAFEAALLRDDAKKALLPALPEAYHPAVARFAELVKDAPPRFLEWVRDIPYEDADRSFPGWDVLRRVGGEIVEVSALGPEDGPTPALAIQGRFLSGTLFQAKCVAGPAQWRLVAVGGPLRELTFPDGWPGPAVLRHVADDGSERTETWPPLAPWDPVVDAFERAVQGEGPSERERSWTSPAPGLGWNDAIRALELDDGVRRSLRYRRAYALDLQEANEETHFKGAMTLVGCSLMWIVPIVLALSVWQPQLRWVIFPALAIFLALQALRWALPARDQDAKPK